MSIQSFIPNGIPLVPNCEAYYGYLPEFLTVTDGNEHIVAAGIILQFPIVVMGRGYNDYGWYNQSLAAIRKKA
ncbi:MAG: hypothetical protein KZQ87_02195 [Candidatus Thiodiazotropha sp. (ex Cardiolucina cf. quadrata)]|nr:hypothetical protein [Candidatus Thiodiazotropha sp. (ex Cardiolucina cf. quadrata)]